MYKHEDIKEVLLKEISKENADPKVIYDEIIDFVKEFNNYETFRLIFDCSAVEKMCKVLNIDFDEGNIAYCIENAIDLFDILKDFLDSNVSDGEKREVFFEFVKEFANASDDEEYCENKIYVIVKNIEKDADFDGEDEYNVVEKFDDIDDAESYVDETYIGCCDDSYYAEEIWFRLLCDIQNNEWDTLVNFSKVFEVDAKGLEVGRENWEAENCEPNNEEGEEDED